MKNIAVFTTVGMQEGADAFVNRLFPVNAKRMNWDPFVLWDHFELDGGEGFPPHPHRGFEGVTYLLEGSMQHEDSIGNKSIVQAGGIQRFTAGKGIVHSEKPAPDRPTSGMQVWVNLKQADKHTPPRYDAVHAEDVPETKGKGWRARHILGPQSAMPMMTEVDMADIRLKAKASYAKDIPAGHHILLYVLEGEVEVGRTRLKAKQAAQALSEGEAHISTTTGTRVILAHGQPHGEPIHQHGPFVD